MPPTTARVVINISIGGKDLTKVEESRRALRGRSAGCWIAVAAGNDGVELKNYGIAGLPGVITVGASDHNGERAFSNWGTAVDIVAPGIDILSLRARYTDTLRDIPGATYKPAGAAYVGAGQAPRASPACSSFSAPLVAGGRPPLLMAKRTRRFARRRRTSSASCSIRPWTSACRGWISSPAMACWTPERPCRRRAASVHQRPGQRRRRHPRRGRAGGGGQGPLADADAFGGASVELGSGRKPRQLQAFPWRR